MAVKDRTRAGLAAAKAQGRTGGRPAVMDADKLAAAKARKAKGESVTAIARALGVSRATPYRALADAEWPDPTGEAVCPWWWMVFLLSGPVGLTMIKDQGDTRWPLLRSHSVP